jgi:hypothetical protein
MRTIKNIFYVFVCIAGITGSAWSKLPQGCKYKITNDGIKIQAQDLKTMGLKGLPANFTYKCENKSDKGMCVPWKTVNVQSHGQAIALAKSYAKRRNNTDIICSRGYFTCNGSDQPHIVCVAKGAQYNKDYYEFIFNSIDEQSDKKWRKGVGLAQCMTFLINDFNYNNVTPAKSLYKDKTYSYADAMRCNVPYDDALGMQGNTDRNYDNCMSMDESLRDNFGFSIMYDLVYKSYSIDSDGCDINFGSISGMSHERKQCTAMMTNNTDIDNDRFHTIQGQLNQQMIAWLGGYVQRHLDEPLESFSCANAFSPCDTGQLTNPTDDVLKCTVNNKSVWFRFDDLSETKQGQLDKTDAAMKCMNTKTGVFDGRRCRGLSKSQCADIDKQVAGGTRWDDELEACVLKAANKQANIDRAVDITLSVGIPAALVVAEVATGGTATPIVLAAIGTATGAASEIMTTSQRNSMQKHLSKLESCKTQQCVKNFLEDYLQTLSSYEYNMPDDVIMTLDEILSKKIQLLAEHDQKRFLTEIQKTRSKDSYWDSFLNDEKAEWQPKDTQAVINAVSLVSSFIPLSSLAIKATKSVKNAKVFLRLPKTSKAIKTVFIKSVKSTTSKTDSIISNSR